MPQTREHLAVLRALGVEAGVIALTKVDLVDTEARLVAEAECEELLPGTPLVAVSSRSGEGLEALRAALAGAAAAAEPQPEVAAGEPLLHVDRCFTVAGRGTVVTGTLWSGRLARGRRVRRASRRGRCPDPRRSRSTGRPGRRPSPRQRVALNLAGPRREEVSRGDVVTVPGAAVATTYRLDVELVEGAAEIAAERRAQVHLGTRESPARVVDLGSGRAQLRLERPLLARRGDRVVVRRIAPPDTLGGGIVRDAGAAAARRRPAPRPAGPDTGRRLRPPATASPRPARSPGGSSPCSRPTGRDRGPPARSPRPWGRTGVGSSRPSGSWPPAEEVVRVGPRHRLRGAGLRRAARGDRRALAGATARPASPRSATPSASAASTRRRCSSGSMPSACCAARETGTYPREVQLRMGASRGGTGLVAHLAFKASRAVQPTAWKVRFLRRLANLRRRPRPRRPAVAAGRRSAAGLPPTGSRP